MRVLFDTSVLAPALVDQLGNHEAAFDVFQLGDIVVAAP